MTMSRHSFLGLGLKSACTVQQAAENKGALHNNCDTHRTGVKGA